MHLDIIGQPLSFPSKPSLTNQITYRVNRFTNYPPTMRFFIHLSSLLLSAISVVGYGASLNGNGSRNCGFDGILRRFRQAFACVQVLAVLQILPALIYLGTLSLIHRAIFSIAIVVFLDQTVDLPIMPPMPKSLRVDLSRSDTDHCSHGGLESLRLPPK